ncbi:MAG TPA: ribonuclease R, partial [Clostridiales bacterium]|nr:ribonuclease R [Clostridiales bacterium]
MALDIKKKILEKTEKYIYTTKAQLGKALRVSAKKLEKPLNELLDAYDLTISKNGKIALASTMGYFKGKLETKRDGYAFLRTESGVPDIFIGKREKNGAMDGEEVLVRLKRGGRRDSPEGKVVKILSNGPVRVVGTVHKNKKTAYVAPDDAKAPEVYLSQTAKQKVKNGQKVVAQLRQRAEADRPAFGEVTEILGMAGDAGVDILSYARRFGLVSGFGKKCAKEARELVGQPYSLQGRLDLRDEMIFTIDGADAKDLDDAISLKTLENGNYLLGVHIADVSHYVREGGELDKEALSRGTSVYLIDRVIPMLPEELSNDLCSLNPQEEKYTLSCLMELDAGGNLASRQFANSVIVSKYRMTYDKVNELLKGEAGEDCEYAGMAGLLKEMDALAKKLRARRFERGSIDFDLNEPKITLDERGVPIEVGV